MKIAIATLVFILTVAGLLIYDKLLAPPDENVVADILESLKTGTEQPIPTTRSSSSPSIKSPTTTRAAPATTDYTLPVNTSTTLSTPTPQQPAATTSIWTPEPSTSVLFTPASLPSHVFYTSHLNYPRSKYIYCDTDKGWKTLSSPSVFSTLEAGLAAFPGKQLHEACK